MQAAVKILNTPFADEEIRKRFQQEREILAQLDHPQLLAYSMVARPKTGRPIWSWNTSKASL